MNLRDLFYVSWQTFKAHKLRTFLSLIGIFIGIAVLVVVMNLSQIAREKVAEFVSRMGIETFRIDYSFFGNVTFETATRELPRRLTLEDLQFIKRSCPHVKEVCEVLFLVFGTEREPFVINAMGVTSDYASLADVRVLKGRFINELDVNLGREVCVIEESPAVYNLFGRMPAIGELINLEGNFYEIIGVVKRNKLIYPERENVVEVFLPYSTVFKKYGHVYGEVYVSALSSAVVQLAMEEVDKALLTLFNGKQEYKSFSHSILLKESLKTINFFSTILLVISLLSLLVGSIGIMNVMLISVTERTSEIGIRMAVGATRRDIFLQFLIESVIICLLGGLSGVGIGAIATGFTVPIFRLEPRFEYFGAMAGTLFSTIVGILAGIFPAVKASKLNPSEALRYE
uniref:FtsX-like permease family protein n=1 Tax=candidate division WOR-3 bacterium TaxID=2052148 RepID=A0A7C2PKI5_UNCW3